MNNVAKQWLSYKLLIFSGKCIYNLTISTIVVHDTQDYLKQKQNHNKKGLIYVHEQRKGE